MKNPAKLGTTYKHVDVEQGTDEWLIWRKSGITATESGIILGRNDKSTQWRLWAEKTGLLLPPNYDNNPFVRHGKEYEGVARDVAEQSITNGQRIIFPTCVESIQFPWLISSLDGIDQNRPVELKCPSGSVIFDAYRKREESVFYKRYWPQVQHQIATLDADMGYLYAVFIDPKEPDCEPFVVKFEIERDEDYIDQLRNEVGQWYEQHILHGEEPEKSESDPWVPTKAEKAFALKMAESDIEKLLKKEAEVKEKLKPIKEELDDAKQKLTDLLVAEGAENYESTLITAKKVIRKGSVNYNKLLKDNGVTLDADKIESYRSKPSSYYKVSLANPNNENHGRDRTTQQEALEADATADNAAQRAQSAWF